MKNRRINTKVTVSANVPPVFPYMYKSNTKSDHSNKSNDYYIINNLVGPEKMSALLGSSQ